MKFQKFKLLIFTTILIAIVATFGAALAYNVNPALKLALAENKEHQDLQPEGYHANYAFYRNGENTNNGVKETKKIVNVNGRDVNNNLIIDWTKEQNYYCVGGRTGFAGQDMLSIEIPTEEKGAIKAYDLYFDFKNKNSIDQDIYNEYFANMRNEYYSLVWLLDNMCYRAPRGDAGKQAMAQEYKQMFLAKALPGVDVKLTDNDIEFLQQMAIWHFTDKDHPSLDWGTDRNGLPRVFLRTATNPSQSVYLDQLINSNGAERADQIKDLYIYLVTEAAKHTSEFTTNPNIGSDEIKPIEIDKTTQVGIEESGSNYIVGPFKIKRNAWVGYYNFNPGFTDKNGDAITYTLLDSNKQPTNQTIQQMIGNNFYISVSNTTNIEKIKLSFTNAFYYQTYTRFYTIQANYAKEQPIGYLERAKKSFGDEREVSPQLPVPEADLALKKFITKITSANGGGNYNIRKRATS